MTISRLSGVVALAMATMAPAATITFTHGIFDHGDDLSTTGTLIEAASFGAGNSTSVTSNGQTIPFNGLGGAASSNLTLSGYAIFADVAVYTGPNITGVAHTGRLFTNFGYSSSGDRDLVTLHNLTSGNSYEFQLLIVDDRNTSNGRTIQALENGGSNSTPELVYTDSTNVGVQMITGTFTADASTQTFLLQNSGSAGASHVSAFQIRQVPEPSTFTLLALAAAGIATRRRR